MPHRLVDRLAARGAAPDYAAIGRFGQLIYVSPRNRVVIVHTGYDTIGVDDDDLTSIFYAAADRL